MRLIDEDTLPKYDGTALSAVAVARAVEEAPSIDIVRCSECKKAEGHWKCTLTGLLNSAYDFCSRGERK